MEKSATSRRFGAIGAIARAGLAIAGGISFLALLLVMHLWVRSYFIAEVLCFEPVAAPEEFASPMPGKAGRWHYQWNLASSRGKVQAERRNLGIGSESSVGIQHYHPGNPEVLVVLKPQDALDMDWHCGGMEYFRRDRGYKITPPVKYWTWGFLIVTVPYWLLVVTTAILPAIVGARLVRRVRRRRRIARGMCLSCGYDLRGGGGICPECGTKVETTGATLRR